MSYNVKKKKEETKEKKCYVGEEQIPDNEINFVYYPNRITPAIEDKFAEAGKAESHSKAYLDIVSQLFKSWDVSQEEGGLPIPFLNENGETNYEELKEIPTEVYGAMLKATREDLTPKKEQPTGSLVG